MDQQSGSVIDHISACVHENQQKSMEKEDGGHRTCVPTGGKMEYGH